MQESALTLGGTKVLVTGGAGFVGSELVHQLCWLGADVTVVDNLINGKRENLADLPADHVHLIVADIRDAACMAAAMDGAEIVYHLACLCLRHSIHSPLENHSVNATGTLQLLHIARDLGVSRFVYTSSAEVYGIPDRMPITEDFPNAPTNPYGAAKLAGEAYVRSFHVTYSFPGVVVRMFNNYGPRCHHEGDCGEVIPRFMLRCMAGLPMVIFGDGRQTRDFNFVTDMARGVLLAGIADEAVGQTMNLGSGVDISINELAEQVADVVGNPKADVVHDAPRPADIPELRADAGKAERILGFMSPTSLHDGLAALYDWYRGTGRPPTELLKQELVHNWRREEMGQHV